VTATVTAKAASIRARVVRIVKQRSHLVFRATPLVALLPAALLRLALARASRSTCLSSARSLACDAPCS
jgi:hypothetical protein